MTIDAAAIVNRLFTYDTFSQWLAIEMVSILPGSCTIAMTVRSEMCNGFGIAHGGISFSFADSAFAFASNSRGKKAVSIETSISHTRAIAIGDRLTAVATEKNLTNATGLYIVEVTNQQNQLVALFKGTVYRKGEWTESDFV